MPKVYHVKKARKARRKLGIKKGQPYYWWSTLRVVGSKGNWRRVSTKHYSLKPPKPSQLASGFAREVLSLQELFDGAFDTMEEVQAIRDEVSGLVDELKSQLEDNLTALPDSFRDGASGEKIQGRINALEAYKDAIDAIDMDEDNDAETTLAELQALQVEYE